MSRKILKEVINGDDNFIRNTLKDMSVSDFYSFCEDAMKQQDRDTRHACAESLESAAIWAGDIGDEVVIVDKAKSSIINCKEGLK